MTSDPRVAAVLTKSWLMGIRRGWLSLLKPAISNWRAVFVAFDRLIEFVNNLEEQIKFEHRGALVGLRDTDEAKDLAAAFKKLREELKGNRNTASHWMSVATDPWRWSMGDKKEEGEHMLVLYQTKFEEILTTHVKSRSSPKHRYRVTRQASLTELLDKILDILRKDAAIVEKTIKQEEGQLGESPFKKDLGDPEFREFSFGRLKVVITAPEATGGYVKSYIKYLDRAHQLIHAKRMDKLWYGVLFLDSMTYTDLSEESQALYKELGYEDLKRTAGTYHSGDDSVHFTMEPTSRVTSTIVHELGHRYWYKFMRPEQRARFNGLVRTNVSEKYRDLPSGQLEGGKKKPVAPVSDYGASSIEEAFAEVFEHYVLNKDMDRDQVESFKAVLASTAQNVLAKFLCAQRTSHRTSLMNPSLFTHAVIHERQ